MLLSANQEKEGKPLRTCAVLRVIEAPLAPIAPGSGWMRMSPLPDLLLAVEPRPLRLAFLLALTCSRML